MKIIYLLTITSFLISQNNLELLSLKFNNEYISKKSIAQLWALENNLSIKEKSSEGKSAEIQFINNGIPKYYITHNRYAAKTAGTNELWTGGILNLNISGSSMNIGMWDDAPVLDTHQEFDGRVINYDTGEASSHATHVAGTIIARGFDHDASGMAFEATLHSYDWNNDLSEVASAANNGLLVSNHSYGAAAGWLWNLYEDDKWVWLGDPSINETQECFLYYQLAENDPECILWSAIQLQ